MLFTNFAKLLNFLDLKLLILTLNLRFNNNITTQKQEDRSFSYFSRILDILETNCILFVRLFYLEGDLNQEPTRNKVSWFGSWLTIF